MRRASLIVLLVLGLVGCKEGYNSLAGPDEARFVAASAAAAPDASPSSRGRRRAVGKSIEQVEGLIQSVSPDTLVVISSKGEEVTIRLETTTVIRHGGTTLTVDDLNEGDRVHVKVRVVGGEKFAVEVNLQNPAGEDPEEGSTATANGLVMNVGMEELTVRTVPHGDVLVRVDGSTIIKRQGVTISLSDIQVGWEVNTRGTRVDAQTIQALQIEVRGNSKKK